MRAKDLIKLIEGKTAKQLIKSVCDEKIGAGAYRDVFSIKNCSNYVIKIERDMSDGNFVNVAEWHNFVDNRYWDKMKVYLAECLMINHTGNVLVQRRVTQGQHDKYPEKIPSMFTDLKYQNFGWIGKRFVCCDYPYLKNVGFRMVKAKFWESK